jgi:hypothetical protein
LTLLGSHNEKETKLRIKSGELELRFLLKVPVLCCIRFLSRTHREMRLTLQPLPEKSQIYLTTFPEVWIKIHILDKR